MVRKEMQNEKIILSISLLVSNRMETIRKCMESLKPILEALPSELIAVDTVEAGKSDGSIDVVREYTEKIIPFPWCDDFAAARNAGLEKACGEWFMFIDDDEWLEDASPIISFFRTGEYKKYRSANYTVRSYTNPEMTYWVDTLQARLFPIEKETRFVGRIHEMVYMEEPICILPCYAHHSGYIFTSAEDRQKHIERNLAILKKEYERNKGNYRTAAHLIQEYEANARFEDTLEVIHESFRLSPNGTGSRFWHYLKLHEMMAYVCRKEFEKGYEAGLSYLNGDRRMLGAEIGIRRLMLEICIQLRKDAEAMGYLRQYLEQCGRIAKEKDLLSVTVMDMNQFWNETNIKKAYARGVTAAYRMGDMEQTAYFIRKIDWQEKEIQVLEDTLEILFHYFESVPFASWMPPIMDAVLERGFSNGDITSAVEALEPDSPERERILRIMASGRNLSVPVIRYRVEYAVLSGDKGLLEQALGELAEHPEGNLLMLPGRVLQRMYDVGVPNEAYVEKVPLYRWHDCVRQWSVEKPLETQKKECFLWRGMMPAQPLYLLEMEAALRKGEATADIENDRDFLELHRSFQAMAEKFHELYSSIYHPDAFTEKGLFTVLPLEAQFAEKYLLATGSLERGDGKGYVSLVREAGICAPAMGNSCRKLLEKYQEYQDARNREQREAQKELEILICTLEGRADQLWREGQRAAAKEIVRQILQVRSDQRLADKYQMSER